MFLSCLDKNDFGYPFISTKEINYLSILNDLDNSVLLEYEVQTQNTKYSQLPCYLTYYHCTLSLLIVLNWNS